MPEEDGLSKGFAFVEFTTHFAAVDAVKQTNGWKLDRSHIFRVNLYEDFSIYDRVSETFKAEEITSYKPKVCLQNRLDCSSKTHSPSLQRKTYGGGLWKQTGAPEISTRLDMVTLRKFIGTMGTKKSQNQSTRKR